VVRRGALGGRYGVRAEDIIRHVARPDDVPRGARRVGFNVPRVRVRPIGPEKNNALTEARALLTIVLPAEQGSGLCWWNR